MLAQGPYTELDLFALVSVLTDEDAIAVAVETQITVIPMQCRATDEQRAA